MGTVLTVVGGLAALAGLVCYIMVVIKMFQTGNVGLGIACLVLILCGIGYLIAFIFGWMKAKEWNISQLMMIWTVCFVISLVFGGGSILSAGVN